MGSVTTSAAPSIFRDDLFRSQVCIVTGGGTGIGRCIAHEIAGLGASVVLIGRREAVLAKTAREIADAGGAVSFEVADIRDEATVASAVNRVRSGTGGSICW